MTKHDTTANCEKKVESGAQEPKDWPTRHKVVLYPWLGSNLGFGLTLHLGTEPGALDQGLQAQADRQPTAGPFKNYEALISGRLDDVDHWLKYI